MDQLKIIQHVAHFFAPAPGPVQAKLLEKGTFSEDRGHIILSSNVEILYQWIDNGLMIFATKHNDIGFPQLYFIYSFDQNGKRLQLAHYNVKTYSPQNRNQTSVLYKQFFSWHPAPLHL